MEFGKIFKKYFFYFLSKVFKKYKKKYLNIIMSREQVIFSTFNTPFVVSLVNNGLQPHLKYFFVEKNHLQLSSEENVLVIGTDLLKRKYKRKQLLKTNYSVEECFKIVDDLHSYEASKKSEDFKRKQDAIKALLEKPETPFNLSLDYSVPFEEFDTTTSFIQKGVVIDGKGFVPYYIYQQRDMCTPMKKDIDNEDIRMYIPKQWLQYAGYDELFLKEYVENVAKICEIPLEIVDKNASFKNLHTYLQDPYGVYLTENSFYVIHISGESPYMYRYLAFTLLRCLYSSYVNNIPGLTFQLMNYFKTDDFLKCLLIAHSSNMYHSQYSLFPQNNYDKKVLIPSPELDKKDFLKNIITFKSLNKVINKILISFDSFKYLQNLFKNKKFDEINVFLKNSESVVFDEQKEKNNKLKNHLNEEHIPFGLGSDNINHKWVQPQVSVYTENNLKAGYQQFFTPDTISGSSSTKISDFVNEKAQEIKKDEKFFKTKINRFYPKK